MTNMLAAVVSILLLGSNLETVHHKGNYIPVFRYKCLKNSANIDRVSIICANIFKHKVQILLDREVFIIGGCRGCRDPPG